MMRKLIAMLLVLMMVISIPLGVSADDISFTAPLNVNWWDRSTQTITGAGTYVFTADLTYDNEVQYCAITVADAYSALSGYDATLKVEANGTVLYDSPYTLVAQWVDDGTGTYVQSNNAYIELYASWNATNLIESIPGGGSLTVTLTLSDDEATEPSTEATEPSTEATEPSTEATEPSTEATEPSTEATEPSTEATGPSTEATEPSTEATEPSTEATEPSTEATEPSTEATEPTSAPKEGNAFLCFSDSDWWPGVSNTSDTKFSTYVGGPGTYTISWDLSTFGWDTANGISVFYIDILDSYSKLSDCKVSSVSVKADGASVPVTLGNVKVYDSEGAYRIELYNMYSSDAPAVSSGLTFSENLTVTFTLKGKDGSNPNTGDPMNLTAVCAALAAAAVGMAVLVPMKKKYF